jgi:hypothetical protein
MPRNGLVMVVVLNLNLVLGEHHTKDASSTLSILPSQNLNTPSLPSSSYGLKGINNDGYDIIKNNGGDSDQFLQQQKLHIFHPQHI